MSHYIARKKLEWEELEKLVLKSRKSMRRMTPEELSRLDILYRRTTVDLAQVATRTRDAALIRYLNELIGAAHVAIYAPPRRNLRRNVWEFLHEGFGRSVARTWKFHVISLVLTIGAAFVAYFAVQVDPVAAYSLMPEALAGSRQFGSSHDQLLKALREGREAGDSYKFFFASFLFTNNLRVGLLSMALGILAGVPTIFLLVYNGMMLGAFTAMYHNVGIYGEYWAWILPHGITEIGAIILCGGVGLQLGYAVVCPGRFSSGESIKRAGREAVLIALGVAIMLVFAAIIESFLRQSNLPTWARLAFAAGTAVFWFAYLRHGAMLERVSLSPQGSVLG